MYINYIDEFIASKILVSADDTKLFGTVANQQDIEVLQNNIINFAVQLKIDLHF